MIIPTLGIIGLHAAGIVADLGTLLILKHIAMLAGMFVAMAARPEEYSGHHHHGAPAAA